MLAKLKRYYGEGDLHYITFGCYHRFKLLGTVRARNVFVRALEEVRRKYAFALVGYVVMPDHVHLLIGESGDATPKKLREKLEYMDRNPVAKNLVKDPIDWIWSSYAAYSGRGALLVEIDFVK